MSSTGIFVFCIS